MNSLLAMSSSFSDFTVFNQLNVNLKTLSVVLGILYYRGKVEQLLTVAFVTPEVEFVSLGTLPRFEGKSKRVVIKE